MVVETIATQRGLRLIQQASTFRVADEYNEYRDIELMAWWSTDPEGRAPPGQR
ncbi:MAG TPA: hypothetical protein PKE26_12355 [Kiritimatiellia bacterium]|nr:hypothetical protein [Kiritimatiellia bacterium]HMO99892.1 hypothetical protein [Kiritimatiellia bacterium]